MLSPLRRRKRLYQVLNLFLNATASSGVAVSAKPPDVITLQLQQLVHDLKFPTAVVLPTLLVLQSVVDIGY